MNSWKARCIKSNGSDWKKGEFIHCKNGIWIDSTAKIGIGFKGCGTFEELVNRSCAEWELIEEKEKDMEEKVLWRAKCVDKQNSCFENGDIIYIDKNGYIHAEKTGFISINRYKTFDSWKEVHNSKWELISPTLEDVLQVGSIVEFKSGAMLYLDKIYDVSYVGKNLLNEIKKLYSVQLTEIWSKPEPKKLTTADATEILKEKFGCDVEIGE